MHRNKETADHAERVRQRAHEIWESEGRPEGRESDHWSRAEAELQNRLGDSQTTGQGMDQPQLEQTPRKPARARKAAGEGAEAPKPARAPRAPRAKPAGERPADIPNEDR